MESDAPAANVFVHIHAVLTKPMVSALAGVVILVAFAAYLILQHRMVFLYHDDWGIAVLDYDFTIFTGDDSVPSRGTEFRVEGFEGRDFALSHAFEYFRAFYMYCGGRVLAFCIEAYVLKGGAEAARAVQVTVIVAMTALVALFAAGLRRLSWAVLLPAVAYLAIPLIVAARGLYWFTASAHSLWGMPFLLGGMVACRFQGRITWVSASLFAAGALFDELMSAATLTVIAVFLIAQAFAKVDRALLVRQAIMAVPTILSTCFIVLAPGNFERARQSEYTGTGPIGAAIGNIRQIGALVTQNSSSQAFLLLWIAALALLSVGMIAERGGRSRIPLVAAAVVIVVVGFAVPQPGALVALCVASLMLFWVQRGQAGGALAAASVAAAMATLVPLLASPGIYPRSLITFYCVMLLPISWAIASVAQRGLILAALSTCLLGVAAVPAVGNATNIYRGYESISFIHEANHQTCEAAERAVQRGEAVGDSLPYYRLPSSRFAEVMPYQRSEIEVWIRRYYRLPADIRFDYRQPEELGGRSSAPSS